MASLPQAAAAASILLPLAGTVVLAAVERAEFVGPAGYLVVEVLDEDLLHVELSAVGDGPPLDRPLYTSPLVLKTDYAGAAAPAVSGNVVETAAIRAVVDEASLCLRVEDRTRGDAHLTTICPAELGRASKGLDIDPGPMRHVYGLGQEFKRLGSADGDWTAHGVREGVGDLGNGFQGFQRAAVGNVQIPVLYAVGDGGLNYALFVDNVYKQRWDFTASPWRARMFGDQLRFYVMTGPNLPDLRKDYMELSGRPPVPPRKAFGLWVSEFGYDNWGQIEDLRDGLRAGGFPLDGFVLDLNWFGGIVLDQPAQSEMGRLDWDRDQEPRLADNPYSFPDPADRIRRYAEDGIGLVAIEESYLADTTAAFRDMPAKLSAYRRTDGRCAHGSQGQPVTGVAGFWGVGRLVDWSDPAAGAWIHAERRWPNLADLGVTAHWTDLGEPETFDPAACYDGVETTAAGRKNEHPDVHNLYNLLWNRSIWDGYFSRRGQANRLGEADPRPLVVTRSGAAGTQRFGAAMWSGDIASNLESLATHLNAQMHMSMSGIDYYGSDIGGFRREVMPHNDKAGSYRGYEGELYTQWLANGAWFDLPVRPHTDNEFVRVDPPYRTAPHLVGDRASNLANLRQRYELIPYYYSLAYRAHLFGEPIVPPLVLYHQGDPAVRRMGHKKLIGRDLLVAVVARHGEHERDVYLPAGRWANYHSDEWVTSTGQWVEDVPVYRAGILRLPAFARAGAIIPQMHVDGATRDAFGRRQNGSPPRDELIVKVYADATPSSFTLHEDDGRTLGYTDDGRPRDRYRTTEISQRRDGSDSATVTIGAAVDKGAEPVPGVVGARSNVVRLVVDGAGAAAVRLNGRPLAEQPSDAALAAAGSGWRNAGPNLIVARSEPMDVRDAKMFDFDLLPAAPSTSVNFVCDRGFTTPGTSVYVVGSIPALGGPSWDTSRAVRLAPSVYYDYIKQPPPGGHHGPGPSAPVWTDVIAGLPPDTSFEWKCIRRREDGGGAVEWQPGANNRFRTGASGFAGRAYGTF
ncbi:MAG TPA: TIM-barrel domain-containing protein [Geminicoccaceae bacterium]|nr:TIM-barrel domain-containing protein [Geminicoccaceae bacterium]